MPTLGRNIITLLPADVNYTNTNIFTVKRIHCFGGVGTVAGNGYRIEDPQGNLLYRSQASGAYYEAESITQRQWPNGFKLITLDSGSIDIEVEFHARTEY